VNKIGIHYGSFVSSWSEYQFPLIRRVKSIGFDVLEFRVPFLLTMINSQLKRFKEELLDLVLCCS